MVVERLLFSIGEAYFQGVFQTSRLDLVQNLAMRHKASGFNSTINWFCCVTQTDENSSTI